MGTLSKHRVPAAPMSLIGQDSTFELRPCLEPVSGLFYDSFSNHHLISAVHFFEFEPNLAAAR